MESAIFLDLRVCLLNLLLLLALSHLVDLDTKYLRGKSFIDLIGFVGQLVKQSMLLGRGQHFEGSCQLIIAEAGSVAQLSNGQLSLRVEL